MKHKTRGIKRLSMLLSVLLLLTLNTLFTPMSASAAVPYTRIIAMKIGSPLALLRIIKKLNDDLKNLEKLQFQGKYRQNTFMKMFTCSSACMI